jgi:hypothetical protein
MFLTFNNVKVCKFLGIFNPYNSLFIDVSEPILNKIVNYRIKIINIDFMIICKFFNNKKFAGYSYSISFIS